MDQKSNLFNWHLFALFDLIDHLFPEKLLGFSGHFAFALALVVGFEMAEAEILEMKRYGEIFHFAVLQFDILRVKGECQGIFIKKVQIAVHSWYFHPFFYHTYQAKREQLDEDISVEHVGRHGNCYLFI